MTSGTVSISLMDLILILLINFISLTLLLYWLVIHRICQSHQYVVQNSEKSTIQPATNSRESPWMASRTPWTYRLQHWQKPRTCHHWVRRIHPSCLPWSPLWLEHITQLTASAAQAGLAHVTAEIEAFTIAFQCSLTASDRKFILHKTNEALPGNEPAFMYLLAKIHKQPMKTRAIISYTGSICHGIAKWLDIYLKNIVKHIQHALCRSIQQLTTAKTLQQKYCQTHALCRNQLSKSCETNHATTMAK